MNATTDDLKTNSVVTFAFIGAPVSSILTVILTFSVFKIFRFDAISISLKKNNLSCLILQ